jgi:hypothetical protein
MANELKVLAMLAKNEKMLQAIGSEIVKEAIKNVIEEKMGLEISDPDFSIEIKKGDLVASELIGDECVQVNSEGLALRSWSRAWKLINRIWRRKWHNHIDCFKANVVINEITGEMILTPEEFKIAKEMGLLSTSL